MGAETFFETAYGKDAKEAFASAVEEAAYEYGHGGYTGSLAEKSSFTVIPFDSGNLDITPEEYAELLIEKSDLRVDDKWGPAGCIELPSEKEGERHFLFFGWASS